MSIPFSRSTRAINIDSYKASQIGIMLSIVLLAVLLGWFFVGKVTLYEVSNELQTSQGRILAKFPSNAIKRIHPGQPAILRIESEIDNRLVSFSAIVIGSNSKQGIVELLPSVNSLSQYLENETLTGQVQVEVEYISPAALIRQSSGIFVEQSKFPLSPQSKD